MQDTQDTQTAVTKMGGSTQSPSKFLLISTQTSGQSIEKMLTKTGLSFELRETDKISNGIRQLVSEPFTAVLLDLNFSDNHGLDVLRHLNQAAPKTPIILLTDNMTDEMSIYAIREGAQDILSKDKLTAEQLLRSIQYAAVRKQIALKLLTNENEYKDLFETAPCGVIILQELAITFANHTFAHLVGINDKTALANKLITDFIHPSYLQYFSDWIKQDPNTQQNLRTIELILIKQDNTPINIEMLGHYLTSNEKTFLQIIAIDITERKKTETELQYLGQNEALGGLINRKFLDEAVKQAILEATKNNSHVAIFYLDLDHFDLICETYGFKTGELLTQAVMQRLKRYARKTDNILMLGKDKFVIVLHDVKHQDAISQILKKFIDIFTMTFLIHDNELYTTASIGISVFPENGTDSQQLLKNTDLALYHAKLQGRNNFQFFTESMSHHIRYKADLLNDLRQAIKNDELILYYQPIVNISTGNIVGLEALLRWHRHNNKMVMPSEFIAMAEETGLIIEIGEWVINTVCRQNITWSNQGMPLLPIAINLSMPQFHSKSNLIDTMKRILNETNLPPQFIYLEMSENVTVLDVASDMLHTLKDMGIQFTLDDFGSNYFSLNDLKRYGVRSVKIDYSLISTIPENKDKCDIVAAIIAMGKELHVHVIAEGVETKNQLDYLNSLGCHLMQGNYICPVLSTDELINYLNYKEKLPYLN